MTSGDHPEVPHRSPHASGPQPDITAYGYGTRREQAVHESSRQPSAPRRAIIVAIVAVAALLAGIGTAILISHFTGDNGDATGALPDAPVASLSPTAEPSPSPASSDSEPTTPATASAEPTPSAGPELIAGPDLEVGACVADPAENAEVGPDGALLVVGYVVVPCIEPHYGEVFMQTESRASAYDEDALVIESEQLCYTGFSSYVGRSYQESELFMEPFAPTADAWAEGSRTVTCIAFDPNDPLTSTVRNSGR